MLPIAKVDFHAGKDIEVVKKLASLEGTRGSVLKGTETLPILPSHSEHSVEGPTSLQLAAKKISAVAENISPEVVTGHSRGNLCYFLSTGSCFPEYHHSGHRSYRFRVP